jgi:hypothetical protein
MLLTGLTVLIGFLEGDTFAKMVVLKPDGEVLLIIIGFLEKGDK